MVGSDFSFILLSDFLLEFFKNYKQWNRLNNLEHNFLAVAYLLFNLKFEVLNENNKMEVLFARYKVAKCAIKNAFWTEATCDEELKDIFIKSNEKDIWW